MFKKKKNDISQDILIKQCEILKVLKSIDDSIVRYFGDGYEPKEEALKQEMHTLGFNKKQLEFIGKLVEHTKEKEYKKIKPKSENICITTKLPCCYCQPVCGSRKEVTV